MAACSLCLSLVVCYAARPELQVSGQCSRCCSRITWRIYHPPFVGYHAAALVFSLISLFDGRIFVEQEVSLTEAYSHARSLYDL
jgi:hypothetical protein